jgi:hypothetical protein
MKNRESVTEVADLKAVAHYEDYLILFIDSQDPNVPDSICVQANFETRHFDEVQPMSVYLGTKTYQRIHDADRRISYRQRILEEMNPQEVAATLSVFAKKRLSVLSNLQPFTHVFPEWEPGG